MKIGLLSHDARKMLMRNLCVAYKGILQKNTVYATATTGRLVEDATGLRIHKFLAGHLGGEEQMIAQIENNDLDLVIFLRDPNITLNSDDNSASIIAACDALNIPLATNLATAETLILALERGDLDWRELYR